MDVALVTTHDPHEADVDEPLLLAALRARGLDAQVVAWDDPAVDWSAPRVAVIRSTWNYIHHLADFRAWVDRAGAATSLWNPPRVIHANIHKSYLRELAGAGVPVTPTVWLARGSNLPLDEILADHGWTDFVIKPEVSAGSYMTFRGSVDDWEAGAEHLRDVVAERDAMLQPYMASVDEYGERSLVWIDGELRHAVRKSPRFAADEERVSPAPVPIAPAEAALAEKAIRTAVRQAEADVLYARVDIANDAEGHPVLMELELVEPSLFLLQAPETLEVFADAIAERID